MKLYEVPYLALVLEVAWFLRVLAETFFGGDVDVKAPEVSLYDTYAEEDRN